MDSGYIRTYFHRKEIIFSLILFIITAVVGIPSITPRFYTHSTVSKYLLPLQENKDDLLSQLLFPKNEQKFFRPLWGLTIWLDYWTWNLNAAGYHLTNLMIHVSSTLVVFLWFKRLIGVSTAFFSALIFGIHPISVVTYSIIDQRGDVLCALFFIMTFFFFQKYVEDCRMGMSRRTHLFFALACTILSLASKESGAAIPFVIAAYTAIVDTQKGRIRRSITLSSPFFLILIIYLVVRTVLFEGIGGYHGGHAHFTLSMDVLFNLNDILLGILLLGSYGPHNPNLIALSILVSGVLCVLCVRYSLSRFGIVWFFLTALLPVTIARTVFLHTDYARFAYLPLIGFLLVLTKRGES